ncbi:hypothetical protein FA15DRAFT_618982 [Coprinopsis marcescibilis]|uniref:Uncharacterized protein n=1 Tax=Coprinopsis marcescibilis TaxID=230819 RepID=A0A5C3KX17_COPMA|nr:hypothetical protein FA15DRAFT_618982 [Coprinopsis marcescibilis]
MKNLKRKEAPDGSEAAKIHPFFSVSKKARSGVPEVSDNAAAPMSEEATTVDNLQELIDFTSINNEAEILTRFDAIAKALLHDYLIVVTRADGTTTRLQILEHEFYLQKAGCHEDPFTHGSEEQKIAGKWYFHRAPLFSADSNRSLTSTTSYRTGSRKGLDLTIGRPESQAHPGDGAKEPPRLRGGVLLRSIRVLSSTGAGKTKVVSGPSLLVDEILSLSGSPEIPDLVQNKWNADTSAFPNANSSTTSTSTVTAESPSISLRLVHKAALGLTATTTTSATKIYSSPRIGLELSHPGTGSAKVRPPHSRIRFLPRKYRYFTCPKELTANGRYQTCLGLLLHFCAKYHAGGSTSKSSATNASASSSSAGVAADKPDLDQILKDNLVRLTADIGGTMGMKEATTKNYLEYFKEGRAGGAGMLDAKFIGAKGKGAGGSPSMYLAMMGAVSTVVTML